MKSSAEIEQELRQLEAGSTPVLTAYLDHAKAYKRKMEEYVDSIIHELPNIEVCSGLQLARSINANDKHVKEILKDTVRQLNNPTVIFDKNQFKIYVYIHTNSVTRRA